MNTPDKQDMHEAFRPFARAGYAARGLVYTVLAFFAATAALGTGEGGDTRDAIRFLTDTTASDILSLVLVVSLAGYALWRVIQSVFDTDDHGYKPTGLVIRAGLLASAFTYGVLTLFTFSLRWGGGGSSGSSGGEGFSGFIASIAGAQLAATLIAAVFTGVAFAHIWKAVRRKYREHFKASEQVMQYVDIAAIGGLMARGVIFLLIAYLFWRQGVSDSDQASLSDALDFIAGLPFGRWLLGATALGLLLFAIYSFCEAIWRRINVEDA
ncbi:DUF1206 domain-containing protein [Nitratireductor basaltis]|uniref:DUF1206 domain-containing protein n=1 Tax=Nitratireductor basaltis TaxID=472175 RepID=A0A084U907_9HYPH|nr:DUF1206 domain-containing protein [Nitratireductor basaltis]KFB09443.1 hypothetical protein EL18_00459 [Nitratireductor basaltis]